MDSVLFLRKYQNEINGNSSELSLDFKGDSFENKKINNKSDIEDNIYYEVINLLTEKLFNNNNKINITVKGISRLCYSLKEILYIKPFQKINKKICLISFLVFFLISMKQTTK